MYTGGDSPKIRSSETEGRRGGAAVLLAGGCNDEEDEEPSLLYLLLLLVRCRWGKMGKRKEDRFIGTGVALLVSQLLLTYRAVRGGWGETPQ